MLIDDFDRRERWAGRLAIGAAVVLGLLVAAAGLAVSQDDCGICGGEGETFRDAMGYVALFLGGLSSALALRGRPGVAVLPGFLGAFAIVAAFFEGMSHLR
jgi:hypothetical protein